MHTCGLSIESIRSCHVCGPEYEQEERIEQLEAALAAMTAERDIYKALLPKTPDDVHRLSDVVAKMGFKREENV